MESEDKNFSDVLNEYSEEEKMIERKLQECEKKHSEIRSKTGGSLEHYDIPANNISVEKREASLLRNQRLLKDLEKSKARLRTLSTFSPTDQELRDLSNFYRSSLGFD